MKSWEEEQRTESYAKIKTLKALALVGVVGASALAILQRIHVAKASQLLVRSGLGIKNIQSGRTFVRWPFQHVQIIETDVMKFKTNPILRTHERLQVRIPGVAMVQLNHTNPEAVKSFALSFSNNSRRDDIIEEAMLGAIRPLVASKGLNSLFSDKSVVQVELAEELTKALENYGLKVVGVYLEELESPDAKNSVFPHVAEVARTQVVADSTMKIAENHRREVVASKEADTATRIRVASLEAEAVEREAELAKKIAEYNASVKNIQIISTQSNDLKQTEADQQVAIKRQDQQREIQRANLLTTAQIEAERVKAETDGIYYSIIKKAEAKQEEIKRQADAERYRLEQVAIGTFSNLEAEAKGLQAIVSAVGGANYFSPYWAMKTNQVEKVADAQARALQGMKPTIFTTDPSASLTNLIGSMGQSLRALEVAGFKLPFDLGSKQSFDLSSKQSFDTNPKVIDTTNYKLKK